MTPDTPILMIALQIPVTPDTRAEDILEALGAQLAAAIEAVHEQRAKSEQEEFEGWDDPEAIEAEEFRASVLKETEESYGDGTRDNLLAQLGYSK